MKVCRKVTVERVKDAITNLGGKSDCWDITLQLREKLDYLDFSSLAIDVRHILYKHCPQHPSEFEGQPVFECIDVWYYKLLKETSELTPNAAQAKYRKQLLKAWGKCQLTGATSELIASHIKPRCHCDTQLEKANSYNGLLLAPHIDKLFDRGLISFDWKGRIMFSTRLQQPDIKTYGLSSNMSIKWLNSEHQHYLNYHRQHIFKS